MAREIKFREWDKQRGTISYGEREDFDDMVGFRFEHTENIDGDLSKERVLEQYTGIVDRRGNAVYENDIVEMDYHKGDHTILDPQTLGMVEQYSDIDTIVRGVVHIWPSTGAIINNISSENPEQFVGDYRIPQYLHINKDCIVIGNIHENPELLEE
ncbi:hypothetical protein EQZ98_03500 [Leuconostoc mesenteroides]|uniref:YopX family protein n=1 Tax=Leuconostoc mesenteroides TaxID=1245 RepID=UPI000FFDFC6D|nr:YopX family protein [Leuconostoc mesenteroides]QAT27246.1 hypothetical protein EQZ98_03500 [Leuconostoc mesenteroides]